MRITQNQLRQIIREELIKETRNPLVVQLQAALGMSAREQDGVWGPKTDAAWASFIDNRLSGRQITDPGGGVVVPKDIAPNWETIAPQISGGLIVHPGSGGGRRIPALTGDTQGALDFIKFLSEDLPSVGSRFPTKQWSYGRRGDLAFYKGFNYNSWPVWSYYDSSAGAMVSDVSPADLLLKYPDFESEIQNGGVINVGGNTAAMQHGAQYYIIADLQTLKDFFKKT